MTAAEKPRIAGLDYLRGLAALAVMLFHFQKWSTEVWDANGLPGKSGVYAVSVFFVLSGLTLTLVYQSRRDRPPADWFSYAVRRIFRIFPLLWLTTLATLLLDDPAYPLQQILLNFSGLFGFFNPSADIALGAWSIGDELVFYAAFPFLLWLGQHDKKWFVLLWVAAVAAGTWYAFRHLNRQQTIVEQWPAYVEPLNHAYFFISGMAIGLWRHKMPVAPAQFWKRALALCGLLYLFYTPGTDPSGLVSGLNRVVLSVLVIVSVGAWHGANMAFSGRADRLFRWLGEVSYSIYLLHPLAYRGWKSLSLQYGEWGSAWVAPAAFATTLLVSHLSYRWFEKPAMEMGRRLVQKVRSVPAGSRKHGQ